MVQTCMVFIENFTETSGKGRGKKGNKIEDVYRSRPTDVKTCARDVSA